MQPFGIVFISFGPDYVDCTHAALRSKLKNAPRTPALVLTNREADLKSKLCRGPGLAIKYLPRPVADVGLVKTELYKYAPWPYVLYLDCDCWINKELSAQFGILDYTPLALTHAYHHPSIGGADHIGEADRAHTLKAVGGMKFMPQYAGGLIFFRRDDVGVRRLFDSWQTEWLVFKKKDQGALLRAVVKTGVFPLVLARKHWLSPVEGNGFVSHSVGPTLPSVPRKGKRAPRHLKSLP